ncbi:glycosyltransferase family 2 protein [Ramlibacter sp. XY19]|uniref:glycosyltransferase family 2 protein n=1 Tax=Ramlibacter paludis TaxID=2908000 RepID=UPI0023D9D9EE|nr:glycosyltransferase family 2 protein [Ramlibacter paludis]MCG2594498.1 glycosyltransferase family 2 protein [Ramlibacter paludis]
MNTVRDPIPRPLVAEARDGPVRLSCVVPCHNEASNLDLLLPQLCELLPRLAAAWEVILVDDGSTDHTARVMRDWAELPGVRVLQLSRNFGKEAALTAGLEAAAGDVVVMMDADLQHPPALLADMLAHWRRGADVVYAVRQGRSDEPLFKRAGTRLFYQLLNRFDKVKVPAGAGDFRLLDRRAVDALLALPERNRFMKGLYAWIGFQSVGLPYMPQPRAHGRSQFSLAKLVGLSIDGLTAFANWPLRIVGALGSALALAAFAYGFWLTLAYMFYGHPISGWTTIVVVMMLFFGMQMIFLGIIGEYVARIFEEVKARPVYLVRREWGRGLAARG